MHCLWNEFVGLWIWWLSNIRKIFFGAVTFKDFSVDIMKNTGLNGYVYDFSVDYDAIPNYGILDIHKYLIKQNNIK